MVTGSSSNVPLSARMPMTAAAPTRAERKEATAVGQRRWRWVGSGGGAGAGAAATTPGTYGGSWGRRPGPVGGSDGAGSGEPGETEAGKTRPEGRTGDSACVANGAWSQLSVGLSTEPIV